MRELLENSKKLVEKVKKYKDWNLTIYFLLMRALLTNKILFEKEKFKIRCLWTQLNFIEGLIEFIEGLIVRKLIFKFKGQIIIFKSWFGQIKGIIT